MKRIFISYCERDKDYREGFEGLLQNPNSRLRAIPISSREDKRSEGKEAVDNYIKKMIKESDIVICLIGDDSHNRPWLEREIELAISMNKKIIGVQIKDKKGAPPSLFIEHNFPLVEYDIDAINKLI